MLNQGLAPFSALQFHATFGRTNVMIASSTVGCFTFFGGTFCSAYVVLIMYPAYYPACPLITFNAVVLFANMPSLPSLLCLVLRYERGPSLSAGVLRRALRGESGKWSAGAGERAPRMISGVSAFARRGCTHPCIAAHAANGFNGHHQPLCMLCACYK